MPGHGAVTATGPSRAGEWAEPSAPPSAGLPSEEDLPGAPMLGLIFLVALLVACGVVRTVVWTFGY